MSITLQQALDRIEQLEALQGVDRSTTARLREAFGLEPGWAEMLGHFYARRGVVSRNSLYTVLYEGRPECEWPDEKIMDVQLSKMRKHLRNNGHKDLCDAIETKWGEGWALTPAGKAIIRRALNEGARRLPALNDHPPLAPAGGYGANG